MGKDMLRDLKLNKTKEYLPHRMGDNLPQDMRGKFLNSIPTSLYRPGANVSIDTNRGATVQSEQNWETQESAVIAPANMYVQNPQIRRITEAALARVNYAPMLQKWEERGSKLEQQPILQQGRTWLTSGSAPGAPFAPYNDGGDSMAHNNLGLFAAAKKGFSRNSALSMARSVVMAPTTPTVPAFDPNNDPTSYTNAIKQALSAATGVNLDAWQKMVDEGIAAQYQQPSRVAGHLAALAGGYLAGGPVGAGTGLGLSAMLQYLQYTKLPISQLESAMLKDPAVKDKAPGFIQQLKDLEMERVQAEARAAQAAATPATRAPYVPTPPPTRPKLNPYDAQAAEYEAKVRKELANQNANNNAYKGYVKRNMHEQLARMQAKDELEVKRLMDKYHKHMSPHRPTQAPTQAPTQPSKPLWESGTKTKPGSGPVGPDGIPIVEEAKNRPQDKDYNWNDYSEEEKKMIEEEMRQEAEDERQREEEKLKVEMEKLRSTQEAKKAATNLWKKYYVEKTLPDMSWEKGPFDPEPPPDTEQSTWMDEQYGDKAWRKAYEAASAAASAASAIDAQRTAWETWIKNQAAGAASYVARKAVNAIDYTFADPFDRLAYEETQDSGSVPKINIEQKADDVSVRTHNNFDDIANQTNAQRAAASAAAAAPDPTKVSPFSAEGQREKKNRELWSAISVVTSNNLRTGLKEDMQKTYDAEPPYSSTSDAELTAWHAWVGKEALKDLKIIEDKDFGLWTPLESAKATAARMFPGLKLHTAGPFNPFESGARRGTDISTHNFLAWTLLTKKRLALGLTLANSARNAWEELKGDKHLFRAKKP